MKDLLVLRDLECIKAIANPKRIDILKSFEKEPLSAKQLSQILEEPHAKINYHIKSLYKSGILELVEEKIKSGIVEKYYYPTAKNIIIEKNVINFSLNNLFEEKDICISKFENISNLFYKSVEDENIDIENIISYDDIYFTDNEINEINEVIKVKINEILNRESQVDKNHGYSLSILSIPVCKNKAYNL